uniref:Uncharacterized protein n=1 Tax=Homalodisca liturata TaxID=320908 RepID=A0A1B6J5N3_9HEMI
MRRVDGIEGSEEGIEEGTLWIPLGPSFSNITFPASICSFLSLALLNNSMCVGGAEGTGTGGCTYTIYLVCLCQHSQCTSLPQLPVPPIYSQVESIQYGLHRDLRTEFSAKKSR